MANQKRSTGERLTEPDPWPDPPAPAPVEPPDVTRPTLEQMIAVPASPAGPVLIVAEVSGKQIEVDVEVATQALIERCHIDDEWNLRACAERFEKMAARLRAEWLRRRGGQP